MGRPLSVAVRRVSTGRMSCQAEQPRGEGNSVAQAGRTVMTEWVCMSAEAEQELRVTSSGCIRGPLWCCKVAIFSVCPVFPPIDAQDLLCLKQKQHLCLLLATVFFKPKLNQCAVKATILNVIFGSSNMPAGPTRSCHAPANSQGVFAAPLVKLILHLLHLGWIKSPEATFTRSAPIFVLHLLKTLVQREVVPHRVLPSIRGSLNREGKGSYRNLTLF